MVLIYREDIDLNEWYKIEDITTILGMQRYKVRAVLAEHKAKINEGLLLPNVFKKGNSWHITGRGLITLLDILGKALPTNKKEKRKRTMAKKTFVKDNPALQLLENEQTQAVATQQPAEEATQVEEQQQLNFIYKKEAQELKTKRVQLVFKPSLYEKLKATAKANNTSVNDYVSQLLENVLKD